MALISGFTRLTVRVAVDASVARYAAFAENATHRSDPRLKTLKPQCGGQIVGHVPPPPLGQLSRNRINSVLSGSVPIRL